MSEKGQSTIELVLFLPVVVAVVLALCQFLAAGITHEYAGHAAEAGAVAIAQGRDPKEAIRDSLPGWSHSKLEYRLSKDERKVRVTVSPPEIIPPLATELESTVAADAGAEQP